MCIIEILESVAVRGLSLAAGTRLLAWKTDRHWRILFNGATLDLPLHAAGEVGSPEVLAAAERRSAREEEYQLAPPPGTPPAPHNPTTSGS